MKQKKLKELKKALSPNKVVIATVSFTEDKLVLSTSQPCDALKNFPCSLHLRSHDMSKTGIDSYVFQIERSRKA